MARANAGFRDREPPSSAGDAGKKKCQETTAMGDKLRLLRFRPDRVHQPTLRGS